MDWYTDMFAMEDSVCCADGTFLDHESASCKDCHANCKTCMYSNNDHTNDEGDCTSCTVDNCAVCDEDNECSMCN